MKKWNKKWTSVWISGGKLRRAVENPGVQKDRVY
jgi:hypothetical protein